MPRGFYSTNERISAADLPLRNPYLWIDLFSSRCLSYISSFKYFTMNFKATERSDNDWQFLGSFFQELGKKLQSYRIWKIRVRTGRTKLGAALFKDNCRHSIKPRCFTCIYSRQNLRTTLIFHISSNAPLWNWRIKSVVICYLYKNFVQITL